MDKLTSMADFYDRVKKDVRYKQVAILAYNEIGYAYTDKSYESSVKWINNWIIKQKDCSSNPEQYTCKD